MLAELTAAVQGLRTVTELVKGSNNLVNQHAIATAVSDVTFKLMEAQNAVLSIQEAQGRDRARIRELEMELEMVEGWATEAARYALTRVAPGKFVYSLKLESAKREPLHSLCPNCFVENRKSILQVRGDTATGGQIYDCQKCKSSLHIPRQ